MLAEALSGLSDPRLEQVTITDARATQDMRQARVLFTVLDPGRREDARAALDAARGPLQARVAERIAARNTPQLEFAFDEHAERADRLTRLIDEVTRETGSRDA